MQELLLRGMLGFLFGTSIAMLDPKLGMWHGFALLAFFAYGNVSLIYRKDLNEKS